MAAAHSAKVSWDAKGVQIYKDGKPIRMADLKRGDKLSATVVTNSQPVVLTAKEVQAVLDEPAAAAPAPTQVAAATPQATPQPAATPPAPATAPASTASELGASRRTIRAGDDVVRADRRNNCVGFVLRAAAETGVSDFVERRHCASLDRHNAAEGQAPSALGPLVSKTTVGVPGDKRHSL